MLDQVCQLARNAGDAIMQVYDGTKPMDVVSKADNSPVTAADIAAHTVIMDGLRTLTPDIPVLSEEDPPGWEVRQHWQRYWLVDPLDGTKEFIKRNGEFTVNIALIDHGKPILGVVYAPVMNVMYSVAEGKAWKEECGVRKQIQVRDARPPLVVISRSHADAELKEYLQQLGEHQTTSIGSSLKFCLVAEGQAQLYPRFGPTNIWDTAAGHAVAAAAGAHVHDWQLSEEDPPGWEVRQHWQRYWLVDPLDGTKEFIKRNGEFTVNIALIDHGKPILGVVYAPVMNVMYSVAEGKAWKEECGVRKQIQVRDARPPLVVISRSHADAELKEYLQQLGEHQTTSIGSSLKFCLVAEGQAQLYPRFGPTNIWDTAAGHAVAAAAGAHVHDWQGKPLDYTPRESFLNPGFRVSIY
ncbi:3'(2'),5'-bisphosphate nucleotidase CysQ [Escherichia coli]|nr:3'(2'),5'-bisphosphate nucleotidase CysQ [Escherichia coli]